MLTIQLRNIGLSVFDSNSIFEEPSKLRFVNKNRELFEITIGYKQNTQIHQVSLSKMGTYAVARGRGALEEMGHKRLGRSDGQKYYLKTLGIRQIVPTKFGKLKGTICRKKFGKLSFTFDKLGFDKLSSCKLSLTLIQIIVLLSRTYFPSIHH